MWNLDRNGLLRRGAAMTDGATSREIDIAVVQGALCRVDRGVYIDGTVLDGLSRHQRKVAVYRYRCFAAATRGESDRLLSHHSAATVLGLDTLSPDLERVHFTLNGTSGGSVKNRISVFHTGPVPDPDVQIVNGVPITCLARTAVDVALSSSFAGALAVFASALKKGVALADLTERLKAPRKGVVQARHALRYADAGAANPGESWCRAQIIEARLPVPVLQKRYDLSDGSVAYADHDFDGKVILEFDGKIKYSDAYLRPGQHPSEIVIAEKLREDKLRELGLDVVRTVWDELRAGTMIPVLRKHLAARGIHGR